ncbi:MAG: flagellar basal-body MS-ring/collar protein FliF [Bryobacteraceae bacterium]
MNQLRQLLDQFSLQQKILIVVAACLVAGGIFFGIRWNKERDLRPLFASLAPEDAAAVVEKLRVANVDYKVADNGAVLVPSARVAELRLDMAAAGLPRSGHLGFELFDKQNFGSTEFDEQVRLRRAIEGELERSVMTLTGVDGARVHVTFAKDSVFSDLRQPAKASVLVRLRPGARLTQQNILAIEHLAASAVEGLQPESVSVVDMNGNLLGKPRSPLDTDAGASSAMLDYRQSLEHDLLVKLRSTLDPLLGAEKYRAGVTLECDFTSGDQSEETFDPDHSVMLTSQKTEESNGSTTSGGVPGTASNLPRPVPPSPGGRGSVSRKTENVTYQTSRVVKHVKLPQGTVKRVSVAILVDQGVHWEGVGPSARRVLDPPSADTLKVVRDVVSGVIGFQQNRGEQVLVETLPFDATLALPAPEPPARPVPLGTPKPSTGLDELSLRLRSLSPLWLISGACLLIVALIAVGVLVKARLRRRMTKMEVAPAGGPPLTPGTSTPAQLGSRGEFEARAMAQLAENRQVQEQAELDALQSLRIVPTTRKAEVFKKFILEEAKKDPGKMAQLVRSWLSGEAV